MKKITLLTVVLCFFWAAHAQLPNPGFEDWDSLTVVNGIRVYDPMHWYSRNTEMIGIGKTAPVSMTTDAHSGKYAVKITSVMDDNEKYAGMLASGYSEGQTTEELDRGEKFKLTGRIKSYSGWYKYTPASELDSFIVMLKFYKNGLSYGSAYYAGGATTEYKHFVWELSYPSNIPSPDSAKFVIISSAYGGNEGTELIIDDIEVQYHTPTGLSHVESNPSIAIYPNPAVDHITLFGLPPKVRSILVANSKGVIVKDAVMKENELDVTHLPSGFYCIVIVDNDGNQSAIKFTKL